MIPRSAIEGLRVFEEVFQVFPDAGSDLDLRGQWGLMQMRCGDRADRDWDARAPHR